MKNKNYALTPTAKRHLRALKADSIRRFGKERTQDYLKNFDQELQYAALNPEKLPLQSQHRIALAGGNDLFLHHIGRHYAAFKFISAQRIIVIAILGDMMDISQRLKELSLMTQREIAAIRKTVH